jgi:hypothetical protein
MKQERVIRPALYVAFHVFFAVVLPHCRSFLSVGLGRMIGFLLLAALLLFTIVQAAGIYKAIASCLRRLPLSWCAPILQARCARITRIVPLVPGEPTLSLLYQRPPPTFC